MPIEIKVLPEKKDFEKELKNITPQLDLLKEIGINMVRMPVMWKALEPEPNYSENELHPEGKKYIELLTMILDEMAKRGIYVLIDFHQDIAHEIFGGDGFPDWAIQKDEVLFNTFPAKVPRDFSWGTNYYDLPPVGAVLTGTGLLSKWVRSTLQSFWLNNLTNIDYGLKDFPVRDHLQKTIGLTAKYFVETNGGKGHPAILGYQPFNEPHPVGLDNIYETQFFGKDAPAKKSKYPFEEVILPEFYKNTISEVRKYDKDSFIFLEPRMNWTVYSPDKEFQNFTFTSSPVSNLDTSVINDEKIVFSFHYYDPWMLSRIFPHNMKDKKKEWSRTFQSLKGAAESRNLIPFLTEFGVSQDWTGESKMKPLAYHFLVVRASMDLLYKNIERYLLNSAFWNYDLYNSDEGKDNWNEENFSLLGPGRKPRHLDIVSRPYPVNSPVEPVLLKFNIISKKCVMIFKGTSADADAPAKIYIPARRHYPAGFDVISSSKYVTWDSEKQILLWKPEKSFEENVLIIQPPYRRNIKLLPTRYHYLKDICRHKLKFQSERSCIQRKKVIIKPGEEVNTGIILEKGDVYSIKAEGNIMEGIIFVKRYSADGGNRNVTDKSIYLKSEPLARPYSLIGKIGEDGKWFFVGKRKFVNLFNSDIYSPLILKINANPGSSLRGSFTCKIKVYREHG